MSVSQSAGRRAFASVAQFCATDSVSSNLKICLSLITEGAKRGSNMIFFPEASDYIASNKTQIAELAEPLSGSFMSAITKSAKENKVWLSIGIHEKTPDSPKPYNSNVLIDDSGEIVSVYRKLHLFKVSIENGPQLSENHHILEGLKICPPVQTPVGKLGLAICYDVRFPELASTLRDMGAHGITYPSVFTEKTGAAHWDVLMRARAIETQTYVYASAQIGNHNHKRSSYGNSMIVDPWGTVIARCPLDTNPCLSTAEINLDYLELVRSQLPVYNSKRLDIFNSS
ncbi:hypothetical protein BB560_003724 [Smittium megazygosporum]|uniref:CN hydrolase domain-containing protein n=1 Tax=Smittium megazygosporum TaxID=133381 RepID=A0A2T9ZBA9_9FUNG|nr:hypothetical protein BB560_003724 [Smittium megazygosporum]